MTYTKLHNMIYPKICFLQLKQNITLICLFLLVISVLKDEGQANCQELTNSYISNAIVKIYTVKHEPDYYNPWRMLNMVNISGSGAIISGERILTNAHVVANHKFIQVRRHGQAERFKAKVIWISHAADLAILSTDSKDFFDDVIPLKLGLLPPPQSEILVYGFPVGGDSLSITKGVLSRIEHQVYTHSSNYFLAGQLDAAINLGNSGGPVLANGEIVGVVMQKDNDKDAENIGYMVPAPIIDHFLKDVADGSYDGFPDLAILTQAMENPAIKHRYKMAPEKTGILVNHVNVTSVVQGLIFVDDIILAVDGHEIADNSSVQLAPDIRTNYNYYIDLYQLNDLVKLKVLRNGKIKEIIIKLSSTGNESLLVPLEEYGITPKYFIFGGLVISQLNKNLLKRWGDNWQKDAPHGFLVKMDEPASKSRRNIIVLLQLLPDDINVGYHDLGTQIIEKINGVELSTLAQAQEIINESEDDYIVFSMVKKFRIVIDRKKALQSHHKILKMYNIEKDTENKKM